MLSPLLRRAGHDVYTPTLTGLGERAHLATPDVGLSTHVQDVVGVLEYEDLRGVVLVGHSLGGTVITGVAERAADRLAHLVYFDAVVPQDGQSSLDLHTPEEVAALEERVRLGGDGWRNPGSSWRKPQAPPTWDAPVSSREWERARLVPHPFKAVREPVRLRNPAALALPRTFIYCTRGRPGEDIHGRRSASLERARTDPRWRHRELDSGHIAMLEAPDKVAGLLLEVVQA